MIINYNSIWGPIIVTAAMLIMLGLIVFVFDYYCKKYDEKQQKEIDDIRQSAAGYVASITHKTNESLF